MILTDKELQELYLAVKLCKKETCILDSSIWNLAPILAKLDDYFKEYEHE